MFGFETSYCSWCFQRTEHALVEQNYLTRNIYRCCRCKKKTVECRYCRNKARAGLWDDELCAEHDGTIANFKNLEAQFEDILDYPKIFKREKANLLQAGKMGVFTLGGAAALGPLALAAAPVVGGAIGSSLLGLSGAAATNAGLAAIGGGSLAAGGFGMAGGAAILGATGAAIGGRLGGVIANSYFGEVEGFKIEQVKNGVGPSVLFMDGFLSQESQYPWDWSRCLRHIYPNNPWYYVRWESKCLVEIGEALGVAAGKAAVNRVVTEWAKKADKKSVNKLNLLDNALSLFGLVTSPWSVACVKAGQTGILLADIIARTPNKYILAGHSLGARVIFYLLESALYEKEELCSGSPLIGRCSR